MKLLLTLALTMLSFLSWAQVPAGVPQSNPTYNSARWFRVDQALIRMPQDTNFVPRFQGTEVYWPNPVAGDTSIWRWTGTRWMKAIPNAQSIDSLTVSVDGDTEYWYYWKNGQSTMYYGQDKRYGILYGLKLYPWSPPLQYKMSPGKFRTLQDLYHVNDSAFVTIDPADTLPRFDVVSLPGHPDPNVPSIIKGTPSENPAVPAISSSSIVVGVIYVPASGDTTPVSPVAYPDNVLYGVAGQVKGDTKFSYDGPGNTLRIGLAPPNFLTNERLRLDGNAAVRGTTSLDGSLIFRGGNSIQWQGSGYPTMTLDYAHNLKLLSLRGTGSGTNQNTNNGVGQFVIFDSAQHRHLAPADNAFNQYIFSLHSDRRGFRLPKVSTARAGIMKDLYRNSGGGLGSLETGMLIYNTDSNAVMVSKPGNLWERVGSSNNILPGGGTGILSLEQLPEGPVKLIDSSTSVAQFGVLALWHDHDFNFTHITQDTLKQVSVMRSGPEGTMLYSIGPNYNLYYPNQSQQRTAASVSVHGGIYKSYVGANPAQNYKSRVILSGEEIVLDAAYTPWGVGAQTGAYSKTPTPEIGLKDVVIDSLTGMLYTVPRSAVQNQYPLNFVTDPDDTYGFLNSIQAKNTEFVFFAKPYNTESFDFDFWEPTFRILYGGIEAYNGNGGIFSLGSELQSVGVDAYIQTANTSPDNNSSDIYINGTQIRFLNPPSGNEIGIGLNGFTASDGLIPPQEEPEQVLTLGANGSTRVITQTALSIIKRIVFGTPSGTSDTQGEVGDKLFDDDYIYIKTSAGWKRIALETF